MNGRSAQWRAGAATLAAVIAMGGVLAWAPWKDESLLPAGVELGDCGAAKTHTVSVSASLIPDAPTSQPTPSPGLAEGTATGMEAGMPRVVLSTPVYPGPDEVAQIGSQVKVSVRQCDGFGVTVTVDPPGVEADAPRANPAVALAPSSLTVQERRLRVGAGSVYVSDPHRLPCGDGGSCGVWPGWYFTVESADRGTATFRAPVQWGAVGASSLDFQGQVEVRVEVDAAV